ncbi:MAG: hypothetical protein OES46_18305 [Gammaproteobacteria bacterium]|nr:hypothetical protein [Gammaproteobacteria bacterium]
MSTFVVVGNSHRPFHRLLDAVVSLKDILPKPIVVQYGHTPFRTPAIEAVDFLGMEQFIDRLKGARLLILHAGVGTVLQAVEAGQVPVVMPRRRAFGEHVDDHQVDYAQAMERAGLVIVAHTCEDLHAAIRSASNRTVKPVSRSPEPQLVALVREALHEVAVSA